MKRQVFQEAIDFYSQKLQLPTSGWTDIWQEQHSHAFVVAGAAQDDLVSDFYSAIKQAQLDGTGYPAFRESFDAIVKKHGWAHTGTPEWRSRIIYRTNVTQSYNAGRYKQRMAVKHLRPFWRYVHTSIEHPRLEHKSWDGIILPADDPWFDTHEPQNGWGCACRIDSLSRIEAEQVWTEQGKTGPDEAPPIEWEERIVGKNGSNPRTVRVPKGIDPGFAYNPGKAWLEPHTVPPLTGYDAVLKERGAAWPTGFTPPPVPTPTLVPASIVLPPNTPPLQAVTDFLDVFGADLQRSSVFHDAAGSSVVISKGLFISGADKESGNFKWLEDSDKKADRLQYINLMAMTLIEPDEIWWNWEKDFDVPGKWRLKRRYLRAFALGDEAHYGVSVFEWGRNGWASSTVFLPLNKKPSARAAYFDRQRVGRLVFKK